MSGTMLAGLLAAVLIGPEADAHRYVVQVDHSTVQFLEGEPEPDAHLCRIEVASNADGSFDTRTQIGRETIECSGVVDDAENGKLHVEVQYAYLEEVTRDSPPDVLGVQTRAKLNPEESVVIGGMETQTTDVIDGVTMTRLRRDTVKLSVRRESNVGNRGRIDAFHP